MGSTSGPTLISENSRTAIGIALQHLTAIEIDIRITRDGHAVIVHDTLVNGRIWDEASRCEAWGKAIEQVALSELRDCVFHNGDSILELRQFLALLHDTRTASTWRSPCGRSRGRRLAGDCRAQTSTT